MINYIIENSKKLQGSVMVEEFKNEELKEFLYKYSDTIADVTAEYINDKYDFNTIDREELIPTVKMMIDTESYGNFDVEISPEQSGDLLGFSALDITLTVVLNLVCSIIAHFLIKKIDHHTSAVSIEEIKEDIILITGKATDFASQNFMH